MLALLVAVVSQVSFGTVTTLDEPGWTSSPQSELEIAWDGNQYLVVWQETRGNHADVFGLRVDGDGQRIDAAAFVIAGGPGDQGKPAVAFDGTNFVVAWSSSFDIYVARVTQAGTVLDTTPIAVAPSPNLQSWPVLASAGGVTLVVWDDVGATNYDIRAARINASGVVLDPASILIADAPYSQWHPAVAAVGQHFLVAWGSLENESVGAWRLLAARVTTTGAVLDPQGIVVSPTAPAVQDQPAIAVRGAEAWIAWRDLRAGLNSVRAARLSGATVLDSPAIVLPNWLTDEPTAMFVAGRYFAVWPGAGAMRQLHYAELAPGGPFTGGNVPSIGFAPAVAAGSPRSALLGFHVGHSALGQSRGRLMVVTWDDELPEPEPVEDAGTVVLDAGVLFPPPADDAGAVVVDAGGLIPPTAEAAFESQPRGVEPVEAAPLMGTPEEPDTTPLRDRCGCDGAAGPLLMLAVLGVVRARRRSRPA